MNQIIVYLAKRAISLGIVIFLIATFVFVVFFTQMGDPSRTLVPRASPELVQQVREDLKLDDPLPVQFVNFLTKVFTGKFFISMGVWKGAPIGEGLPPALLATLSIFVPVFIAAGLFGGGIGILTSRSREGRIISRLARFASVVILAIPALVLVFWLTDIVPRHDYRNTTIGSVYAALTAFMLSWPLLVLMEKGKDRYYATFGQSLEGQGEDSHRPAQASPMTKLFAGWTLSAVLISEVGFGTHGLGFLLWNSVLSRDWTLLMSVIVVVAFMPPITNFLLDVASPFVKDLISNWSSRNRRFQGEDAQPKQPSEQQLVTQEPLFSAAGIKSMVWGFARLPFGLIAFALIIGLVILSAASPIISTVKDTQNDIEPNFVQGGSFWFNPRPPSLTPSQYTGYVHPFGTDQAGRDVYSLVLLGTGDALGVAWSITLISVLVASAAWILAIALIKFRGVLRTLFGAAGSVVSDFALAIPLLALAFTPLGLAAGISDLNLIAWLWRWAALLAFALVFYSARAMQGPITAALESPGGSIVRSFSRAIPHILYATKFVAIATFVSMAALVSLGYGHPGTGFGSLVWAQLIEQAFQSSAFATGAWWTYAFSSAFIVLLVVCLYAFLDSLETVARKRWGTIETHPKVVQTLSY